MKLKRNLVNIWNVLEKLLYLLDRKQKRSGILIFVSTLVGAFWELLGVTAIIPFMYALLDIESLKQNIILSYCIELFHISTDLGVIIFLGGCLILLYVTKDAYMLWAAYMQTRYGTRLQEELSVKLFRSYMNRPYTYFLDINSAMIQRNINNDIQGVYSIIQNLFFLGTEFFMAVLLIIFFFITDVYLAMGITALSMVCFGCVTFFFKRKMAEMGIRQRKARGARNKCINQSIHGIKEILVMQRRKSVIEKFERLSEEKRKTDLVYGFSMSCPERIIEAVCVSGLIITICIRIAMGVDVQSFIPSLGAFAVAAFKILPSLSKLSKGVSQITFYMPSLNETYKSLKESKEYVEDDSLPETTKSNNHENFKDRIEIKNITWKYKRAKTEVLKDLSMTITRGESIALIGGSGAGKTTLADVILGLLKPQQGTVTVDGRDIFSIPMEWSRMIGYVPQSVFLTDDTVRNNVAFGLPPEEIDEDKVWKALEEAQLKDFVKELPKGLDTIVGERGVKFSGGQRQRISIARALYYSPEILVLDEATAALDNETEKAIMESIDSLRGNKTLIIIAHRLTTIRNCGKIYEVTDGKAVLRDKNEVLKEK